ncbi:hypothetical protein EON63_12935 [archaeon]|nr:MAG: hypothetical protein EON63_12935 [archaeon]
MSLDQIFRSLSFFIIGVCFTIVFMSLMHQTDWMAPDCDVTTAIESDVNNIHQGHNSTLIPTHCSSVSFIPPFANLQGLVSILKSENKKSGVAIRGGNGDIVNTTLSLWKTADEFVVVDTWMKNNTLDISSLESVKRVGIFLQTNYHVKNYLVCQNTSSSCAKKYPDEHFDFVLLNYHQADHKTLTNDLTTWWPKVKVGGLVGGTGGTQPTPNSFSNLSRISSRIGGKG